MAHRWNPLFCFFFFSWWIDPSHTYGWKLWCLKGKRKTMPSLGMHKESPFGPPLWSIQGTAGRSRDLIKYDRSMPRIRHMPSREKRSADWDSGYDVPWRRKNINMNVVNDTVRWIYYSSELRYDKWCRPDASGQWMICRGQAMGEWGVNLRRGIKWKFALIFCTSSSTPHVRDVAQRWNSPLDFVIYLTYLYLLHIILLLKKRKRTWGTRGIKCWHHLYLLRGFCWVPPHPPLLAFHYSIYNSIFPTHCDWSVW